MDIDMKKEGTDLIVELGGKINTNNAAELESKFKNIDKDINRLLFHLEKLRYISSAGLRVFLQLYKNLQPKGIEVILVKPNELVESIFESTGLTNIITIEK